VKSANENNKIGDILSEWRQIYAFLLGVWGEIIKVLVVCLVSSFDYFFFFSRFFYCSRPPTYGTGGLGLIHFKFWLIIVQRVRIK